MTSTKAVLIPGDAPPSESSLKRQLLFFDSLIVPTADDAAILNDKEISEAFTTKIMFWGTTCPYPRSSSYDDQLRHLQANAEPATRSGKLQFVSVRARSPFEAIQNWVAAVAATKTESLFKAALPDHQPDVPGVRMSSSHGSNLVFMSEAGHESQYQWTTKVDTRPAIPVAEEWRAVALGRLGRALKIVRRASASNAIPLAVDSTNRNICLALGAQAYGSLPTPGALSAAAVALDTVDPVALDAALETMGWPEVLRIRKEVLPAVVKLRGLIQASVKAASRPQNAAIEPYLAALNKLKDDYRGARDAASTAWKQIGFRTLETGATAAAGLTMIAPNNTWATVLTAGATALVAQAVTGVGMDFSAIMRGKDQKASPLFAFDELVTLGEAELTKDAKSK